MSIFYILWFDLNGNQTVVYHFASRRYIHLNENYNCVQTFVAPLKSKSKFHKMFSLAKQQLFA